MCILNTSATNKVYKHYCRNICTTCVITFISLTTDVARHCDVLTWLYVLCCTSINNSGNYDNITIVTLLLVMWSLYRVVTRLIGDVSCA